MTDISHTFIGVLTDDPECGYHLTSLSGESYDLLSQFFTDHHTDWIGKRLRITIEKLEDS